jgi:hypothetical protein
VAGERRKFPPLSYLDHHKSQSQIYNCESQTQMIVGYDPFAAPIIRAANNSIEAQIESADAK